MPWTDSDAKRHTKLATTAALRDRWAAIANAILKKTGDDAKAIRIANAAIARIKSG